VPDDAQSSARAEGALGLDLFEASKWQEAFDRFRAADAIYHAPTLTLFMARCQSKLGHLLAARALYQALIGEVLPPKATDVFRQAQRDAATELVALEMAIPTLEIIVRGSTAPSVTIDGASAALSPAKNELDPGEHRVAVTARGMSPWSSTVPVGAGQALQIPITLRPLPIAEAPRRVVPDDAPPESGSTWLYPSIAYGAGALALGVSVVTGAIAVSETDDIKSRCDGSQCLAADAEQGSRAQTMTTLSTITGIIAVTGAVVGTGLLLWYPESAPDRSAARVEVFLGAGTAELRGAF